MINKVTEILARIKRDSGGELTVAVTEETDLRRDLSFSSLDLATLTAEIEDEFGVDLFENDFVYTVGDIVKKITK